jgi:hypothetical protein
VVGEFEVAPVAAAAEPAAAGTMAAPPAVRSGRGRGGGGAGAASG